MASDSKDSATDISGRERCATGIEGLDNILNGGIPRGNTILFTGSCGTGKTTLSLEFLVHGAIAGENCLFISVTETSDKLMNNVIPYDFFDENLIKKGVLSFVDMPVWYTHNIKNIGEEDLFTIFWINELFNPKDADTYFEIV